MMPSPSISRSSARKRSNWGTALYRKAPAERQVATARFVPYHLWDNRAPGEMLVWVQSDR